MNAYRINIVYVGKLRAQKRRTMLNTQSGRVFFFASGRDTVIHHASGAAL